eukprot:15002719-Alexandrium_andersonii.AAC.1
MEDAYLVPALPVPRRLAAPLVMTVAAAALPPVSGAMPTAPALTPPLPGPWKRRLPAESGRPARKPP